MDKDLNENQNFYLKTGYRSILKKKKKANPPFSYNLFYDLKQNFRRQEVGIVPSLKSSQAAWFLEPGRYERMIKIQSKFKRERE